MREAKAGSRNRASVRASTKCVVCSTGALAIILLISLSGTAVWAQPQMGWSTVQVLSEVEAAGEFVWPPVLLQDPVGNAHLFWSIQTAASGFRGGDLIGYAVFADGTWSPANTIVHAAHGLQPGQLSAAYDPTTGALSVFWLSSDRTVYYAQAPASEAWSARSWSPPRALPLYGDVMDVPEVVVDEEGVLNAVLALEHMVVNLRADQGLDGRVETTGISGLSEGYRGDVSDVVLDLECVKHLGTTQAGY